MHIAKLIVRAKHPGERWSTVTSQSVEATEPDEAIIRRITAEDAQVEGIQITRTYSYYTNDKRFRKGPR